MGSDLNCPLFINPPTVHDRHERENHCRHYCVRHLSSLSTDRRQRRAVLNGRSFYPLKEKAAGTNVIHFPFIDEKWRRKVMKYLILGTALALALPLTSAIGVANAQDVRISVGDRDHGYWRGDGWRRHHWRGAYAYDRGCRVVVTNRINRFGDHVTVRKRICY
jgi:hypothetical protein